MFEKPHKTLAQSNFYISCKSEYQYLSISRFIQRLLFQLYNFWHKNFNIIRSQR